MNPTSSIISKGKKERNRSQKMMVLFFLLSLAARCQFWDLALSYLEAVISWMLTWDVRLMGQRQRTLATQQTVWTWVYSHQLSLTPKFQGVMQEAYVYASHVVGHITRKGLWAWGTCSKHSNPALCPKAGCSLIPQGFSQQLWSCDLAPVEWADFCILSRPSNMCRISRNPWWRVSHSRNLT